MVIVLLIVAYHIIYLDRSCIYLRLFIIFRYLDTSTLLHTSLWTVFCQGLDAITGRMFSISRYCLFVLRFYSLIKLFCLIKWATMCGSGWYRASFPESGTRMLFDIVLNKAVTSLIFRIFRDMPFYPILLLWKVKEIRALFFLDM